MFETDLEEDGTSFALDRTRSILRFKQDCLESCLKFFERTCIKSLKSQLERITSSSEVSQKALYTELVLSNALILQIASNIADFLINDESAAKSLWRGNSGGGN